MSLEYMICLEMSGSGVATGEANIVVARRLILRVQVVALAESVVAEHLIVSLQVTIESLIVVV